MCCMRLCLCAFAPPSFSPLFSTPRRSLHLPLPILLRPTLPHPPLLPLPRLLPLPPPFLLLLCFSSSCFLFVQFLFCFFPFLLLLLMFWFLFFVLVLFFF